MCGVFLCECVHISAREYVTQPSPTTFNFHGQILERHVCLCACVRVRACMFLWAYMSPPVVRFGRELAYIYTDSCGRGPINSPV